MRPMISERASQVCWESDVLIAVATLTIVVNAKIDCKGVVNAEVWAGRRIPIASGLLSGGMCVREPRQHSSA